MFPVMTIIPFRRLTPGWEGLSSLMPCGTKSAHAPGTVCIYSTASSLFTKVMQPNRFAWLESYRFSRRMRLRYSGLEYHGYIGNIFLVFNAGGSSRLQIVGPEYQSGRN